MDDSFPQSGMKYLVDVLDPPPFKRYSDVKKSLRSRFDLKQKLILC